MGHGRDNVPTSTPTMICIIASGNFLSTYGGGQVYVRQVVAALRRRLGAGQVAVISCDPTFPASPRHSDHDGVALHEVNPHADGARDALVALLRRLAPQVVHINGEKPLFASLCHQLGLRSVVTAHHGGIVCPAGTLLNARDEICHVPASPTGCLPCYLRNIRTGSLWFPFLKRCSTDRYVAFGRWLRGKPFIPFLSPIGGAALAVHEKLEAWHTLQANADLFIAPSPAMRDALVRNGARPEQTTLVPHGTPPHADQPPQVRSGLYYAGRICYVKGIHILLAAFHALPTETTLHLIGGANSHADMRYMRRLQRKYRKDRRIVWHGKVPLDRMHEATQGLAALVHPTICLEVFGLNIAEALSQGQWVIATRCGGAEAQITDGENGTLVPPNDPIALRAALQAYLAQPRQPHGSHVLSVEEHVSLLLETYRIRQ